MSPRVRAKRALIAALRKLAPAIPLGASFFFGNRRAATPRPAAAAERSRPEATLTRPIT